MAEALEVLAKSARNTRASDTKETLTQAFLNLATQHECESLVVNLTSSR